MKPVPNESLPLDRFSRYQKQLKFDDVFPIPKGRFCRCGCGESIAHLRGNARWLNKDHQKAAADHFFLIKGHSQTIRALLYERDKGICCGCGVKRWWEADHVIPVAEGGGACELDNFQTLCADCHKAKTAAMYSESPAYT